MCGAPKSGPAEADAVIKPHAAASTTETMGTQPRAIGGAHRHLVAVAALLSALACAPPALAIDAEYPTAVITSVDGPRHLTLRTDAGRTLPVRLAGIDGPNAGECGAAEATTALRQLAAKRGGRVYFELARRGRTGIRGADGRYLASLQSRLRAVRGEPRYGGVFEARLIELGWARTGVDPATPAAERVASLEAGSTADSGSDSISGIARRGGIWQACGGWMHRQPGSIPAAAPAVWSIDRLGLTHAIGPVTLPSDVSPAAALTLGQLRDRIGALEVTIGDGGCVGHNPALRISAVVFLRDEQDSSCDDEPVYVIESTGPDPISTDRGARTGGPADQLRGAFDAVTTAALERASDTGALRLSAGGFTPWAWKSGATIDRGRVIGFSTVLVTGPDRPGE